MPPATRLGRLITRQFGEFEAGSARSVEGPCRYPEAGVERHRASPQIGSARARLVAPSPQPRRARARCPPTPASQKRLLGTPASRQPAGPFDSAEGRLPALQSFFRSLFSRATSKARKGTTSPTGATAALMRG